MNACILSGRVAKAPVYQEIQGANGLFRIATFILAVRKNYGNEACFFRMKAFNKNADFVKKYLTVGTGVITEGELVSSSYEDKKNGKKSYVTEVNVARIEFVGSKVADDHSRNPVPPDIPEDFGSELPFR